MYYHHHHGRIWIVINDKIECVFNFIDKLNKLILNQHQYHQKTFVVKNIGAVFKYHGPIESEDVCRNFIKEYMKTNFVKNLYCSSYYVSSGKQIKKLKQLDKHIKQIKLECN